MDSPIREVEEPYSFSYSCNLLLINHKHFIVTVFLSVLPQDVSGMSLSMLAAAGGQDDILRLLIKKGVRVNGRQKNGTTALMHAAEKVSHPVMSHVSF